MSDVTAPIRSVLVANRGEISVRVSRTLRSMGIRSIAVFTDADEDAAHRAAADTAVRIGPPGAYLDVDAVMRATAASGADALHPGYGFLSENPSLAEACERAGVVFIGPPASAIRAMGDKINAKELVSSAGVPVVPGMSGRELDDRELVEAALRIGLPVLLKPSAGGGGKGMRRVDTPEVLPEAIAAARREALAAFGDGTLLIERFVTRPRHIEIQVLADNHGSFLALGERECTLQRRHQKIIEETPSTLLDVSTRSAMESAAVTVAKACGYSGAGTVEFIVSAAAPGEFFFMEMNTRLQVEHPVTEMVRGLDLVEWQVRVATGERLPWSEPPSARGHAVEARVYAEDPSSGFLPSTGTIRLLREPRAEGIRVDSALTVGTKVGVDYDPMLSKIVAWGSDRDQALARLRLALDNMCIAGVKTNVEFLRQLLDVGEVVSGDVDTALVERVAPGLPGAGDPVRAAAVASLLVGTLGKSPGEGGAWYLLDGWRVGGPGARTTRWSVQGREISVSVAGDPLTGARVSCDGSEPLDARVVPEGSASASVELEGVAERYLFASEADRLWLCTGSTSWELNQLRDRVGSGHDIGVAAGAITSPMPGTVLAVHVEEGDPVKRGAPMVTVEAMKMEHVVPAPSDGTVAKILVAENQSVALGQPLAELVHGIGP